MPIDASGIHAEQTVTYEVIDLASDHVHAKVETSQTAGRQPMKVPDLPAGASVILDSERLSGRGEQTAWFDQPAQTSTLTIAVESNLTMKQGTETQNMQMKTSVQTDTR